MKQCMLFKWQESLDRHCMEFLETFTTTLIKLRSTSNLACIYHGSIWWHKNSTRSLSWVIFKKSTHVVQNANSCHSRCTQFTSGVTLSYFSKSNFKIWATKWISPIHMYFHQLKTVWQHCYWYLRISYFFDHVRMECRDEVKYTNHLTII